MTTEFRCPTTHRRPKRSNGKPPDNLRPHGHTPDLTVRRDKARSLSGCKSRPATIAPAGSNRSSRGGNEAAEAFGAKGHQVAPRACRPLRDVNAEQASKR
jgi:hypothetical protein